MLTVLVLPFGSAASQTPPPGVPYAAGFQPGGQPLFVLDLANTPIGEIPANIKLLQGTLEVVLKDGVPMLKASSASAFLITLPQPLPPDFTLEFDLVPKACCNPADLGIGEVNQGAASAHIEWDSDGQLRVVGGGELYQAPMPDDFTAVLPGVRTQVGLSFQGTTVKLYTNGRRLFTLDRQFARKRELRISLGGQDDRAQAVYLAGLRIATGGPLIGIVQTTPQPGPRSATPFVPNSTAPVAPPSGTASPMPPPPAGAVPAQTTGTITPMPAAPPSTASTSLSASGGARVVPNVAVTMGSGGPLVTWGLLGGTSSYTVKRWKLNDLTCCNAASTGLSGPPWQDGALPVAGTYVYEVTASNPGWTATGQAQFVQFKSPGQIATVAPSGTIAPTSPAVTSGVTGVTSGATAPPNSAISRILPPPPKILALNGITGSGASRLVPARAIALPTVVASGGFRPVAPRLITLAAVSGTGPVIVLNRSLPGITVAAIPVPRTIALAPIDAVGVKLIPAPRTVSLTGLHATGGYRVAASRVVSLPEISAAGVYP